MSIFMLILMLMLLLLLLMLMIYQTSILMLMLIVIFRECGAPYLFLSALFHPSIRWRSQEFRLHWGGKAEVEVVDDKKKKKKKEEEEEDVFFNKQEVQAIKLVSNSGKLGEFMSSRSIS